MHYHIYLITYGMAFITPINGTGWAVCNNTDKIFCLNMYFVCGKRPYVVCGNMPVEACRPTMVCSPWCPHLWDWKTNTAPLPTSVQTLSSTFAWSKCIMQIYVYTSSIISPAVSFCMGSLNIEVKPDGRGSSIPEIGLFSSLVRLAVVENDILFKKCGVRNISRLLLEAILNLSVEQCWRETIRHWPE